jgi:hypothetical protein
MDHQEDFKELRKRKNSVSGKGKGKEKKITQADEEQLIIYCWIVNWYRQSS